MITFAYDGTLDGLLCAVFDAYTRRRFPDALLGGPGGPGGPSLLHACAHRVDTDAGRAARVFRALKAKLSPKGGRAFVYAWLAAEREPGADMALFRYICKVFDARRSIEGDLGDQHLLAVLRLARKARGERHLLLGFTRFQKSAQGVYFAALSPRYNVLPLLLPHFAERFSSQPWLLYDLTRRYGILSDNGVYHDVALDDERAERLANTRGRLDESDLAGDELLIQWLWQSYFKAAAIPERANPKQQRRCMPRRYWDFMTEKQ